jgi:hypothetical protein
MIHLVSANDTLPLYKRRYDKQEEIRKTEKSINSIAES